MPGRRIARSYLGTPRGRTVRDDLLAGALERCWGRPSCVDVFVMENRRTTAIEALRNTGARANRTQLYQVGRMARAFAQQVPAPPGRDLLQQLYSRAPVLQPFGSRYNEARTPRPTQVPGTPPGTEEPPRRKRGRPPKHAPSPGGVAPAVPDPFAPQSGQAPTPASAEAKRRGRKPKQADPDQLAIDVLMRAAHGETLVEDNPALRIAREKLKDRPDLQAILAQLPPLEPAPAAPPGPAPAPARTLSREEIDQLQLSPPLSRAERLAQLPRRVGGTKLF